MVDVLTHEPLINSGWTAHSTAFAMIKKMKAPCERTIISPAKETKRERVKGENFANYA